MRTTLLILIALSFACADSPAPHPDATSDTTLNPDADTHSDTTLDSDASPDTPAPFTLHRILPSEGPTEGGTQILIEGSDFSPDMELLFGGAPALELTVLSHERATASTPAHPAGSVDLSLQRFTPEGDLDTLLLERAFQYTDPIALQRITPSQGPRDTLTPIVVHGEGFTTATRLFIDGQPAWNLQYIDPQTLHADTPPLGPGPATIQIRNAHQVHTLPDAFLFLDAPRIDHLLPITGRPEGGERLTIFGAGLNTTTPLYLGEAPLHPEYASPDGTWLITLSPPAPAGTTAPHIPVPLSLFPPNPGPDTAPLQRLPDAFHYLNQPPATSPTRCQYLSPSSGLPGSAVHILCPGLGDTPLSARFGAETLPLLSRQSEHDLAAFQLPDTPPATPHTAVITTQIGTEPWTPVAPFTLNPPTGPQLLALTPQEAPAHTETAFTLTGHDLPEDATLRIGAHPPTSWERLDATTFTGTLPPLPPGTYSLTLTSETATLRLEGALDIYADTLQAHLLSPHLAARAGGTLLRVHGDALTPDTQLTFGAAPCPIVEWISSTELICRSPRLPLGYHDLRLTQGGRTATLPDALLSFDPRSGTEGTRGPKIRGTVDITVWGTQGYGPIEGAHVILGDDPDTPHQGYTDDAGQLTLSAPDIRGPLTVTATHEGFTAYSLSGADAQHITLPLVQDPRPPTQGSGGNPPITFPPNATLSGQVIGFDKYIPLPPVGCDDIPLDADTPDLQCAPCAPEHPDACDQDPNYACLSLGPAADAHCLLTCQNDSDCPTATACGATSHGPRCLPFAGTRRAYCNVSMVSELSHEYPIQTTAWVDDEGRFSLDSTRLGELALYCVGGVTDSRGRFTPTALGLKRHLFAQSRQHIQGLRVTLDHPLDTDIRLLFDDPPESPTGLKPPSLLINLVLGGDGIIPMTRPLHESPDGTWTLPNQLRELTGPLYDTTYLLYTTFAPEGTEAPTPRSYHLLRDLPSLHYDRLPQWKDGAWTDLPNGGHNLVAALTVDDTTWFAGREGALLYTDGDHLLRAPSPTDEDLLSLGASPSGRLFAGGQNGALLVHGPQGWQRLSQSPNPEDPLRALHVTDAEVYAAGRYRLWRIDLDTLSWRPLGPPALQGALDLIHYDGHLLALTRAGIYASAHPTLPESWSLHPYPSSISPLAFAYADDTLTVIGRQGALLYGPAPDQLTPHTLPTSRDLLSLSHTGEDWLIGSEGGLLFQGPHPTSLVPASPPAYAGPIHAIAPRPDGYILTSSAALVIGPLAHFPTISPPSLKPDTGALRIHWAWTGPDADYTRLSLIPEGRISQWTFITDGPIDTADIPDTLGITGYSPLYPSTYRLSLLRAINRHFDIDAYAPADFNFGRRRAWAVHERSFTLPP